MSATAGVSVMNDGTPSRSSASAVSRRFALLDRKTRSGERPTIFSRDGS